jgi:non-specific serine/threonine protein kinase
MGDVYLAEDGELRRKVALKFLSIHYVDDNEFKARFRREAQAAASLEHPNIVTVYEVGEFQNRPFYAMQYIEGKSLAALIEETELSIWNLVHLAIQICEGLDRAHREQIVHRDIKPSNVLIDSDGLAKLVDFGLAAVHGSEHLTKAGSAIGTACYMSPEQAQGKDIDLRSDLFSLGIVLYEMATGRTPFDRGNMVATAQAIVYESPNPLTDHRGGIPDKLQQIISKLLQKDREARYQHAHDLLVDLKSLLDAIESGRIEFAERGKPDLQSIAVLPFANLTGDASQEYFCEGVSEEIINALTRVRGLRVASRSSSFIYKKIEEDIRTIGRKLDVNTVLEGSVRKAKDRLRITVQLVGVADGYHLWSERFDREVTDIFTIQDEIAENVARALQIILSDADKRAIATIRTPDFEAYDYYLKGKQFLHQGRKKSFQFAKQMFARAVEIDAEYALAYTGIANCCSFLVHYYPHASDTTAEEAGSASRKALELDPALAEAHAAHGFALWLMDRRDEARAEFETAILFDPKQFEARYLYARACFQWGETKRALRLFEEACLIRDDHEARFFAAQSYATLGREKDAKEAYRRALHAIERRLELNPDDARAVTMGAVSLCRLGQPDDGLKWADRAVAIDPEDPGIRYNVACLFALQGQGDKAIATLQEAFRAGFANTEWVEKDPDLSSLRDDPRFKALLDRRR